MNRTYLTLTIAMMAAVTSPALAQSAVGGPAKPINHVGGATNHPNLVVPPAKGVTASAAPTHPTSTKNVAPSPTPTKRK